jgi:Rps23 Pro-64 3,4-dihydroxylase Tpa1-like proline 4-hydroxylase
MDISEIINPDILRHQRIKGFREQFCESKPIRYLIIDDFLDNAFANVIAGHFPSIEEMKIHYHGINEQKSEHSDFSRLDISFSQLRDILSSESFIQLLNKITHIENLETIHDRLGYGLHQGANNSFLDIHIDYNLHPIQKKYRRLNFILFFNEKWQTNWGGNLELWDEEVKTCVQSILPIFNRCMIFECSNVSYHGYSRVNVPDGITRKSYYHYYFVPAEAHISFHDTIFKSRPQESIIKKIMTPSKDFLKNSAKKIFYKIGLKRFLG